MKSANNTFILVLSSFGIAYIAAAAAYAIGLFPVNVLNFPGFISCYVAASALALAVSDYSRPARPRPRRSRQPEARGHPAAAPVPSGAPATWTHNTLSA